MTETPQTSRNGGSRQPAVDVVDIDRKNHGCTVVAHLSDLHFTALSALDGKPWIELEQDLHEQRETIDAIVVTGDVIDASVGDWVRRRIPTAFDAIYKYLIRLCVAANVPPQALIAVPGNHDTRLKGFAPIYLTKAFQRSFAAAFRPRHLPRLRLFVYPFDSNRTAWKGELAAGEVAHNSFIELRRAIEEVKQSDEGSWALCNRIALLHHHPMPIAATEHRSLENMEEFLLLRNAGMFMTEMLRSNVDLILHGHKHYPCASKATYLEDGSRRSVAVVACGSSGAAVRQPTYNLITFFDGGRIALDRRIRTAVTFKNDENTIELRSYAEARDVRYERLAKNSDFSINVRHYSRVDLIEPYSGDVHIIEDYEDTTSATETPVERLTVKFVSRTGYFAAPQHEPSSIGWEWAGPAENGRRSGSSIFDPPIGTNPVTFRRRRRVANAFHFSQQDRKEATGKAETEEWIKYTIVDQIEVLVMAVVFPENRFPSDIRLHIGERGSSKEKRPRDLEEEQHCAAGLTVLPASRTAVFSVAKPLPGYQYELRWRLPEVDPVEPYLREEALGIAEEALNRLIDETVHRTPAVLRALEELKNEFESALLVADTAGGPPDMEVALFARASENGLRCLYSNITDPTDPVLHTDIASGREIVGQAYRRRQAVLYTPRSEEALFRGKEQRPKTAIFAMPLFFPVVKGRRIAVLSLASSSHLTPLLRLADDRALLKSVTENVMVWSKKRLSAALGLFEHFQRSWE